MVQTPSINDSQLDSLVAVRMNTASLKVPGVASLVAVNFPTKNIHDSQITSLVATRQTTPLIRASQLTTLVATTGRPTNPRLRAWTFDLDGHQFYVLKLGTDDKTLVYDLNTGQWSWWASGNQTWWRATTGQNWVSSGIQAYRHGSNVVIGDDSLGILWMLNPEQGYDDSSNASDRATGNVIPFDRLATGQMITRMRQYVPVHQVYLTASVGEPAFTNAYVQLNYSDDLAHTFIASNQITSVAGQYNQEFAWRSLGAFGPAGRLFQIYDNGAFARIDGLDITSGSAATS